MDFLCLVFQEGTDDLDGFIAMGKDLAAGEEEFIFTRAGDGIQSFLAQPKHHPADVAPKDRPGAHRAGFGAGVEGAVCEEFSFV